MDSRVTGNELNDKVMLCQWGSHTVTSLIYVPVHLVPRHSIISFCHRVEEVVYYSNFLYMSFFCLETGLWLTYFSRTVITKAAILFGFGIPPRYTINWEGGSKS